MAISRGFEGMFSTEGMLFCQNTPRTGNNAIEMSQVFHNIARFERFIDLNLFKYPFNVIQNWETDSLQILFDGATCSFFSSYGRGR